MRVRREAPVGDLGKNIPEAEEFLLNLIVKKLHLPELNAAFTVICY